MSSAIAKVFGFYPGLLVTLKNLFLRPKVTIRYPEERRAISPRYRGMFYLQFNDEKGRLNCIGCTLCAQACPTGVITMHKATKGVDAFDMDLGKCMFCGLCVEACTSSALKMGQEYEFATYEKDGCIKHIEDLAEGGIESVRRNLEIVCPQCEVE